MVLDSDPNNVKALYRCGKVLMVKGEMDDAIVHLQKATNLSPDERVRAIIWPAEIKLANGVLSIRNSLQISIEWMSITIYAYHEAWFTIII